MTQKERAVEWIIESVNGCARHWAEIIADHLIAKGAIFPPCKVGNTVWFHNCSENGCLSTAKGEVTAIVEREGRYFLEIRSHNIILGRLFDEVYLTCEAAEQALKELEKE